MPPVFLVLRKPFSIEKGGRLVLMMISFSDYTIFNSNMTVLFNLGGNIFDFSYTSFGDLFVIAFRYGWMTSMLLSIHCDPS